MHIDTYEFLVPYWTNILGYVQKLSSASEALDSFIKQRQEKALKKMLVLSCGKEKAQQYKFDHRNYIVDRMKELQFLAIDENLSL